MNNIKRTFLIIILLLSIITGFRDSYSQINIITERLKNSLIEQNVNDDEISRHLDNLKPDGSWSDVDYKNRSSANWDPLTHSNRLQLICIAYNKPESRFFHKKQVKDKIIKMFEFYIDEKPESDNWWYNAIGGPNNLSPALVLMKSNDGYGIEQAQLERYTGGLVNFYSESAKKWSFATTGANKIWLLNSSINKACIMNDEEVLKENFRLAFEEVKIMGGKAEGIKIDNSFWQHGPQLYCAGYGKSFLSDITRFGALAHSTDYAMSPAQVKTITDAVLDGYQWFCQNNAFDFSSAGREISRRGAVSSASLKTSIARLISTSAPRKEELQNFIKFIDGEVPFQSPGNRHFWESDIMVQHGSDYYFSAKVPSKRTNATERMNNENLKRKWLPWGATNIMKEGDEYRNLFPVWDWSRIPGVTSFMEDVPGLPVTGGAYLVSPSEFAGGVSDGIIGLAAYDYSWDGVSGKKAWFFTPKAIYGVGAGIKAGKNNPVITSVNQCFSSGPVIVKDGKKKNTESTSIDSGELKWAYHDGFGYIFPAGGNIAMRNMDQTGSWSDINLSQSSEKITYKVFSLWISHGKNPSSANYEYIVVPSVDAEETDIWAKKNPLKLIRNTPDIQAFHDKRSCTYAIAFYSPGTVSLEKALIVGADNPCLLLLKDDKNKISITVSDPAQRLEKLVLKISGKISGNGVLTGSDGTSTVNIDLPSGDEAGKSLSLEYPKI